MKLPTAYLPERPKTIVRFAIVGTTGMFVQTWIFMGALWLMGHPEQATALYYTAFAIGYLMELIPNYLFSNWYTFGTKPDLKNAGGFLLSRVVNLFVQFGLLPWMLIWLDGWRDDHISYIVIFIGGCINYIICSLFFKRKKKKEENENL